ncbi:MAG: DUF4340 domain-containing protein [Planctomycetes bacterium]|nr:DUF4340 domain-containing protein [Planctomycetota bacterium]
MTENAKTITFVIVGMLAVVIGIASRPSSAELDEKSLEGTDLTKNFTSVEDAKRLRIVRFDEDTATRREFEVAEQDGLWSIPSKDGYPADAARQMAEAATSLMDRKILQVASGSAGDHEQFGVIDPSSPKLEAGQNGVGTRVTIFNEQQDPLVDLIVGKAVKGAEGQRYVREAGRNMVYVIEIDRSKLSTNFEDWIEKDLLKLNSWDLQQVDVKDYSATLVQVMTPEGPSIGIDRDDRAELTLGYSDSDGKWTPVKLRSFDRSKGEDGEYVDFTLAEDEELNDESLNGLKTALDDLQIVDVVRKPQGLSEDLKAGAEFVSNQKAFLDLVSKGFTATGIGAGAPQDIISSDGEVVATMKNGAEYVLRFGNLTNVAGGEKPEDAAATGQAADAAAGADEKKADNDVNRYMFVMARFNENAVKQPELETLPELPSSEEAKPATEAVPADAAAGDAAASATPPAEGAPATPATEANAETPKAEEAKADESKPAATDEPKNADAPAAVPAAEKEKELEKVMAQRKRIEQENQRKMDEYQETLKKGKEAVKDLNLRFGDWYFVVDDNVFQKIRLGRDDVIKKKEKPKAEGEAPAGATNPFPGAGTAPAGLPEIPSAKQE